MKINYIILASIFIWVAVSAKAQQDSTKLKKEVEVVKAYQPSLSDARKINDIPKIKEDKPTKPEFEYSIYSEPIFSTFSVKPVQAAKIVGEPKTEIGKGLLKLGVGNYMTPYGELFYNALPGKKSNFGMHFKHHSSHGKIKLLNDDKVEAPFSDNYAEIFHKHFYRNSTLSLNGFFERKGFQYYGYTGDLMTDANKEATIPLWNDKQAFSKGGIKINLASNQSPRADMNYDLGLYYHYFGSKTNQTEHYGKVNVNLDKNFDGFRGVLESSLSYYLVDGINNRLNTSLQRQQILLIANPAVVFTKDNAMLQLGAKTFTMIDDDVDAKITITPNVKAEWAPVKDILTLYASADGMLEQNRYSKIAKENPFAAPDHDIRDTEYRYIISGGMKGKFSTKTNYLIGASYSNIKDKAFYYTSTFDYNNLLGATPRLISNTFDVLYDNLTLFKLSGEIFHASSENLSFHLKGNYYIYELNNVTEAWNMPDYDINFSISLKTDGPLSFNLNSYIIGQRQGLIKDLISSPLSSAAARYTEYSIKMDPYFDLNASLEYEYSKNLSFFLQLNNFAFQKYENWLGYANQGFNALAGVNFSF